MTYDPAYDSTIATVIPVLFVTLAIDLKLNERARAPKEAGSVLSVVVLLLCAELLCLTSLSGRHELTKVHQIIVDAALGLSGLLIFLRVAEPLTTAIRGSRLGGGLLTVFTIEALVLIILYTNETIGGATAVVIFSLSVIAVGWVGPGFVYAVGHGLSSPKALSSRAEDEASRDD